MCGICDGEMEEERETAYSIHCWCKKCGYSISYTHDGYGHDFEKDEESYILECKCGKDIEIELLGIWGLPLYAKCPKCGRNIKVSLDSNDEIREEYLEDC